MCMAMSWNWFGNGAMCCASLPTLSESFGRVVAEALENMVALSPQLTEPVWSDLDEGQGHCLKGFRDGRSDEVRVRLLMSNALMSMVGSGSDERRQPCHDLRVPKEVDDAGG